MAKEGMLQREVKRQKLVNRHANKRADLLNQLKNAESLPEIFELQKKLQRLPANSSRVRLKNRCWKTGRPRGYYRDFGLSRHVVREMAHECLLPGVKKSSW